MHPNSSPLNQLNILVTRPEALANSFVTLIENEGGTAQLFPVICIEDVDDTQFKLTILNQLDSFDIAIFISPTAVHKTFERLSHLPASLQIAVIGSSTADALKQRDVTVTIAPKGHDSEALLRHPQLQSGCMSGKSIIIFRGLGGREELADTLRERGANVQYAEVYQRVRPNNIAPLTDSAINAIDVITITSNEGLKNLFEMNTHTHLLIEKPIVVPGTRARKFAESLGFTDIVQAENATNIAYIKALKHWRKAHL